MKKIRRELVEVIRVGDSDAGRIVGKSLKALRESAGLTQDEMARRLNVGQAAISKMERRGDVQISSLQKYVRALGARIRIDAVLPPEVGAAPESCGTGAEAREDGQLIFPIFEDEFFHDLRDVVISIRPQYSEKIMQGKKTVELRRRFPISAPPGTIAHIYSTSPVRAIVGRVRIAKVIKLPIDLIWHEYAGAASIEKSDFDSYFSGLEEGFALRFENVRPLPRQIDLSELRQRFGFEPPQSFLYASPLLRRALQDEYSNVSH